MHSCLPDQSPSPGWVTGQARITFCHRKNYLQGVNWSMKTSSLLSPTKASTLILASLGLMNGYSEAASVLERASPSHSDSTDNRLQALENEIRDYRAIAE